MVQTTQITDICARLRRAVSLSWTNAEQTSREIL